MQTANPQAMKTRLFVSSVAIVATALSTAFAAEDNPIKKAMQYAHKAPEGQKKIGEKIIAGTATDEEVKKTLDAYRAAVDTQPPRGDAAAFKEKFTKLITATEAVAAKKDGAAEKYKTAVNCKACHGDHKPK